LGKGIEQHLVRLDQVGPHDERPAVRQLRVRHPQLSAVAAQHRPILAPVKLERIAGGKGQRHKSAAAADLGILLARRLPRSRKDRNPAIGAL